MLDTVSITSSEFVNILTNVNSVLTERPGYSDHIYKPDKVPLPSYDLVISDTLVKMRYVYDTDTGILRSFFTIADQEKIELTAVMVGKDLYTDFVYKNEVQQFKFIKRCGDAGTTPKKFATEFAKCFFAINFYLVNLPTEIREVKEKISETYVEKKKGDKRYKNRVVLKRTLYINAKPLSKNKIKHIIKCLCWGVRGHERHYKSGKVVFIKPFRKGVERNNANAYVPKEYVLGKEENYAKN